MSDIGILNDPLSITIIALLFGNPGLAVGAIAWRRHRIAGALIGAVAGFVVCLTGVMV